MSVKNRKMSNISQKNINDSDYSEILSAAISQIKNARTFIAKQINSSATSVYWGQSTKRKI